MMFAMSRLKPVWEVVKIIVGVFIVAGFIRWFVMAPFIVDGSSMEPNFHNNEYIVVEKVSYRLHDPRRGDVIVLQYPGNISIDYIKRIVGLPGETVKIVNGEVFINGSQIHETYLLPNQLTTISQSTETPYQVTLDKDQYFMLGDNRDHSSDSRDWGVLQRDLIVGRAAMVLYPSQDFHAVAAPNYN